MKGLSIRQPWLWMMLHGKDVENRVRASAVAHTKHRGTLFLHASKGRGRMEEQRYYDDARRWLDARGIDLALPPLAELPRGVICARTELVAIIPPCIGVREVDLFGVERFGPCSRRWHMHDQFGLLVRDTVATPLVARGGALFLFNVGDDLIEKLRGAA